MCGILNLGTNMMKKIVYIFMFLFLFSGCSNKDDAVKSAPKPTIVVAKLQSPVLQLYFTGTLQPLETIPVLSPVDGQVTSLLFSYGEQIKKDKLLVRIGSTQLADKYRKSVGDYLQKKDQYQRNIQSYQNDLMLYRAGVISRDQFTQSKGQFETSVLDYYQSQYDLEKVLRKVGIPVSVIEKLTISQTQEINETLKRKFNDINVVAPGAGVALFPTKDPGSSDSGNKNGDGVLRIGSDLKENDLMLMIGDMTGLTVSLKVNETDINRIRTNMPVSITGDAFPGVTLHGVIESVSSQAQPGQDNSGQSQFLVIVKVPKINEEQEKVLHVGMSARVEVDIKQAPQVMLPIRAVSFNAAGQPVVTILDSAGQRKQVIVTPGTTTPTQITIISGVTPGQKIEVPPPHKDEASKNDD